jgi:hypothetical protein
MKLTMKLTVDDLIRALQIRGHRLAAGLAPRAPAAIRAVAARGKPVGNAGRERT